MHRMTEWLSVRFGKSKLYVKGSKGQKRVRKGELYNVTMRTCVVGQLAVVKYSLVMKAIKIINYSHCIHSI